MSASIFNDVLGPVMIGPSSSHTAGPARIGKVGWQLLGEQAREIVIRFDTMGSFAACYNSQGSDFGFVGGLLGIDTADERMRSSLETARQMGIKVTFLKERLREVVHPNQAEITLTGVHGRIVELMAVSTGGGMFEVLRYQGFPVSLRGDSYDLLLTGGPELASEIQARTQGMQSFEMNVAPCEASGRFLAQLKFDRAPQDALIQRLREIPKLAELLEVRPVLPVVKRRDRQAPFTTAEEALAYAGREHLQPWELACVYEETISGKGREEILALAEKVMEVMRESAVRGLAGGYHQRGFLPPQICKAAQNMERPGARAFQMGLLTKASLWAAAAMEYDICMGCCVAAPTGGSCGVLPGAVISIGEDMNLPKERILQGLLTAGLVGVFIAHGATFAAETCGCQAENGSASAMAAAGLVQLLNGSAEEAFAAAALALENVLGLICDPVAGVGNIPCVSRNSMAVVNAVLCANLVLNGFDPYIPLDQVIDAMKRVGSLMAEEHRCTGRGGLCTTEAGQRAEKYWQECCAKA